MKNRWGYWLVFVFLVLCVPVMMGAYCDKPKEEGEYTRPGDESIEETMEKRDPLPVYPGAVADTSEQATMKASSVGGTMYVTTDSFDKVSAYYEKELAGKTGYAKHGSSRYTYQDNMGSTVDVLVMPTEDGNGSNILISSK